MGGGWGAGSPWVVRTAPGCGMTNHGQFDFRGLLRKTNTHIADDVYPHQIPVGTMCCPGAQRLRDCRRCAAC